MKDQIAIGLHRGLGLILAIGLVIGADWVLDKVLGEKPFEERVMTDPKTGCQYVYRTGPTPRIDANGKIICIARATNTGGK